MIELYLIEFLHQTTTKKLYFCLNLCCILLNFYIKPQPNSNTQFRSLCCILLNFYIKPQQERHWRMHGRRLYLIEFLHQTTTLDRLRFTWTKLYLIEFLHQTTTVIEFLHQTTTCINALSLVQCCILLNFYIKPQLCNRGNRAGFGCILLNFYIKPQPYYEKALDNPVVSYWISTSNHNTKHGTLNSISLYLIEFLHQTTTIVLNFNFVRSCILLNFYIKPQLPDLIFIQIRGCILLNFYIKPQLLSGRSGRACVVSYWISTSNHNRIW